MFLVERIETERSKMETSAWEATELRKALPANENAPKAARDALSFVGADIPEESLQTALLLTSELVTNSVVHGPSGPSSVGLLISVERNVLQGRGLGRLAACCDAESAKRGRRSWPHLRRGHGQPLGLGT